MLRVNIIKNKDLRSIDLLKWFPIEPNNNALTRPFHIKSILNFSFWGTHSLSAACLMLPAIHYL